MNTRFIVIGLIVLAVAAAGGSVYLVNDFLSSQSQQVAVKEEGPKSNVYVLVARQNLPTGTKLSSGNVSWEPWPEEAVKREYLSAKSENDEEKQKYAGHVVRFAIASGEPVTRQKIFKRGEAGFLSGVLEPGMRAVSVSVKPDSGAAGFILPGDRVDVILTADLRRAGGTLGTGGSITRGNVARYAAETVVRDVRVVAVDQVVDDVNEEAKVVKTVTMQVTPKQAEIVAVARAMGNISLTLRSMERFELAGFGGPTTDLQVSSTMSGLYGRQPETKEPKPTPQRTYRRGWRVNVYRGTERESVSGK